MNLRYLLIGALSCAALAWLSGCDEPTPVNPPRAEINISPRVRAIAPTSARVGQLVDLTGFALDSRSDTLELEWVQFDGPPVELTIKDDGNASFIVPEHARDHTLRFAFSAIDSRGAGASEDVAIYVPPGQQSDAVLDMSAELGAHGDVLLTLSHPEEERPGTIELHRFDAKTMNWEPILHDGELIVESSTSGTTDLTWDSSEAVSPHLPERVWLRARYIGSSELVLEALVHTPEIDRLTESVSAVQDYIITYGPIDEQDIRRLETYDLVIVHPTQTNSTRAQIADIQDGVDPLTPTDDAIVLCYIPIGEDMRTIGLSDADMLSDPRFVYDGSGPRVDPRGPDADGESFAGINPFGAASPGGNGFAPWYLDDNSIDNDPANMGDGVPDRTDLFGPAFVNMGHPAWYSELERFTFESSGYPGISELLTHTTGRGLGCDGLFLDTSGTAAPNSFTDSTSPNQREFEWTAPGFKALIGRIKEAHPRAVLAQNRGIFFFDSSYPHFEHHTGCAIDFVLYDSFRLDADPERDFNPFFYADNRYNFAPKLIAESQKFDFAILSMGYAEGDVVSHDDLFARGTSSGHESLVLDITATREELGFLHYITDRSVSLLNDFVAEYASSDDDAPPVWSSVYNTNTHLYPTPADAPTPRVGLQRLTSVGGGIVLEWDVAVDKSDVDYIAYVRDTPFDFSQSNPLRGASVHHLHPSTPSSYAIEGASEQSYPFKATIDGLDDNKEYFVLLRARDSSPNQNEDKNRNILSASSLPSTKYQITIDGDFEDWSQIEPAHVDPDDPGDSAGPDWRDIKIANDDERLCVFFQSGHEFRLDGAPAYAFSRTLIFFDVDGDPATGYALDPEFGSDFQLNGNVLYSQAREQWAVKQVTAAEVSSLDASRDRVELCIPYSALSVTSEVATINIVFLNDETNDRAPDSGAIQYTRSL